jgi:hypothetical protein
VQFRHDPPSRFNRGFVLRVSQRSTLPRLSGKLVNLYVILSIVASFCAFSQWSDGVAGFVLRISRSAW